MGHGSATVLRRTSTPGRAERDRAEWHERASVLYEDLRRPATALIRRAYGAKLGDPEIEDIYSNAWLGTLRSLERKHADLTDDEIGSYLLTSVANHASKEIRRRRRKPVAPIEAAGAVAEDTATPEEQAQTAESSALTRDLLSSLPPRRRAVLLLRYGWELAPDEVCRMVDGLSPRAYRKEVTKGVDQLIERIKLVEEGRWCEEREPLLKTFAAGLASEDEALQAERHMTHCRSCSEFVGKLTGHLHDVGSAILLPGALEGADGHSDILERVRGTYESIRETATGAFSRSDTSEAVTVVTGTRGGGVAGAGILVKLSGLGSGAKTALTCAGGAVAASACVVAGVGPVALPGPPDELVDQRQKKTPPLAELDLGETRPEVSGPVDEVAPEPAPSGDQPARERSKEEVPVSQEAPLAPETPPVTQELGVESGAEPVGPPPPQTDPASSGGAVAQEFGP